MVDAFDEIVEPCRPQDGVASTVAFGNIRKCDWFDVRVPTARQLLGV
jgi:hypothetical protein